MDLLLVHSSLDHKSDHSAMLKRRVEDDVAIQNSPAPGIAYLIASAKKHGIETKFIDMVADGFDIAALLDYIGEHKPALVGFTALTVQITAAGAIAAEVKKRFPEIPVCAGGVHPTVMPKETLEQFSGFDFVVCGEGEHVICSIFDNLRRGLPVSGIKGVVTRGKTDISYDVVEGLDDLPFPAWEELDLSKYKGIYPHRTRLELPMWTSRGCPFSCIFCVRPLGSRRRRRSIASVISELERNISEFKCESIAFIDETFVADIGWSMELFNTMIAKGINKKITWSCETRVDAASPELFKLMKKAGCYYIFFGLESSDEKILRTAKKGISTAMVRQAVAWTKEAGIIPSGSFIIGLPGETEETVKKTIAFAQELGLYSITFPIAVPYPGTELRRMAQKHEYGLKILSDNWNDYDKQYPGIMESATLGIDRIRELQKMAYDALPKKKIADYIEKYLGSKF